MGNDDYADQGNEGGDELLTGEGLSEKDVARPRCNKGDEEAENGAFSEGEVVDGI